MESSSEVLFTVFSIVSLNSFANAVPTDYCYGRLNKSDCDHQPVPVFTYYKPGSRCEIELWRGCPTLNKFNSEFECSHFCIGLLSPTFSAEMNAISNEVKDLNPECQHPINLEDCGQEEDDVYTYMRDINQCVQVSWKGCPCDNKFETKQLCQETCGLEVEEEPSYETDDDIDPEKEKEKETTGTAKGDITGGTTAAGSGGTDVTGGESTAAAASGETTAAAAGGETTAAAQGGETTAAAGGDATTAAAAEETTAAAK